MPSNFPFCLLGQTSWGMSLLQSLTATVQIGRILEKWTFITVDNNAVMNVIFINFYYSLNRQCTVWKTRVGYKFTVRIPQCRVCACHAQGILKLLLTFIQISKNRREQEEKGCVNCTSIKKKEKEGEKRITRIAKLNKKERSQLFREYCKFFLNHTSKSNCHMHCHLYLWLEI